MHPDLPLAHRLADPADAIRGGGTGSALEDDVVRVICILPLDAPTGVERALARRLDDAILAGVG